MIPRLLAAAALAAGAAAPPARAGNRPARAGVIARLLAAAALAAGAAAAPAPAAEVTLVDPTTALTGRPPFPAPAGGGEREEEAPSAGQRVDSRELVTTGVDGAGRPVAVTVEQRLRVTGTGDYLYTVPAPVLSVAATPDSQSEPGRRAGAILWAGFSDRRRLLGGRARLRSAAAASLLPLRLRLRVSVAGRSPRASGAAGRWRSR